MINNLVSSIKCSAALKNDYSTAKKAYLTSDICCQNSHFFKPMSMKLPVAQN